MDWLGNGKVEGKVVANRPWEAERSSGRTFIRSPPSGSEPLKKANREWGGKDHHAARRDHSSHDPAGSKGKLRQRLGRKRE